MKLHLTLALAALGIAASNAHQPPQSAVFSDADRKRALDFWAPADRYAIAPTPAAAGQGPTVVRLTAAGSQWLWSYSRLKSTAKQPPTLDARSAAPGSPWETWIDAKVAFDRATAQIAADQANGVPAGVEFPPDPGPCPADLAQAVGPPPVFAEAVIPNTYSIRFDDVTLTYTDHPKMRPRYAYYRSPQGVESGGIALRAMPAGRIDHLYRLAGVDLATGNVMRCVSALEGGFDSVNTYDTGFVSVGFIQFASLKAGAGSLGDLLLSYKTTDPQDFDKDFTRFGVSVTPEGVLDVLDPATGQELQGPDANQKIIDDKRLIAVFGRAGARSDAFIAAQIACARSLFFPDGDTITLTLAGAPVTCKVCDLIRSEAGLATLMDRKVNTGKIDPLQAVAQRVADANSCQNLVELAQYEADIVKQLKWRRDYMADLTLSQPQSTAELSARHGSHKGSR